MTIIELQSKVIARADRWHNGNMHEWSPLEWAGAMCGEAGEAANAAKKLKRMTDGIASINAPDRMPLNDKEACRAVARECADTILYAILLMSVVGIDADVCLREVFNKKSEEYNFPERL